ncbi:hypothetical protein MMC20_003874 [Loxospora ochrophaea]|nr:hypothetical protein [Loxospora ochrophaea]
METAIRWSPNSTASEQRFLVADVVGRSFKHCRVTKYTDQEFRYETLSTHNRAPVFRAFDWSPLNEAIVAVGQWSGEAAVLNIQNSTQVFSLPIKSQRQCNAVAFNKTGLLATGLERVRNDFCLNVFDINQRISTQHTLSPGSSRQPVDSIRKLASSEGITSIRFFTKQPDTLIAGVKGACVRVYDLRESTGSPSLQFQTAHIHYLSIDPTNENYFASAGPPRDTTIHIWDRRSAARPVSTGLSYNSENNAQDGPTLVLGNAVETETKSDQANIWGLRYCPTQHGCLGILSSTGEFKIVETREEHTHERREGSIVGGSLQVYSSQNTRQLFTKHANKVELPYGDNCQHRKEIDRIVSFDFTNLVGSRGRACAILLRGNHSIEIHQSREHHPTIAAPLTGGLLLGKPKAILHTKALDLLENRSGLVNARLAHNSNLKPSNDGRISNATDGQGRASSEPGNDSGVPSVMPNQKRLASETANSRDPTSAQLTDHEARRRCADGYLFDCDKNMKIVADGLHLQSMWNWIGRARSLAADDGMVARQVDLSYLGVYSFWHGDANRSEGSRSPDSREREASISEAIKDLCNDLQLPEIPLPQTSKLEHRLLSLHTSGLAFTEDELAERIKDLIHDKRITEAALLALMYNKKRLASESLRSGGSPQIYQTLALALASVRGGKADDGWQEIIVDIAKRIEDPFARAILTLVSQDSWDSVVAEPSLPFQYRVGATLMHLDDQQIASFLQREQESAIKGGLVEGVLITGLYHHALELFEAYIARSKDLPTSVLAMSFTAPLYIRDVRFQVWREGYRSIMNSWKMRLERTRFDVQSTKLAGGRDGQKFLQTMTPQVTLRCDNCDQALDRNPDHQTFAPLKEQFVRDAVAICLGAPYAVCGLEYLMFIVAGFLLKQATKRN